MKSRFLKVVLSWVFVFLMFLSACGTENVGEDKNENAGENTNTSVGGDTSDLEVKDVLPFDGKTAYVSIQNNRPNFKPSDMTTTSYERYSDLDSLGRCGVVMACVGIDIMPTEDRGSIGQVKPSGWHTVKYDIVDGKYLYNRCHLIGYQLTGENANVKNLITGTRYLNIEGMLPFENMIADYVKETGNHVLYRVTPIFVGNNLVASGVQMEGYSVEDDGEGICFNVYAYNAQPGISIDYATGESALGEDLNVGGNGSNTTENKTGYVLNTSSKKIHLPTCKSVDDIKAQNKAVSDRSLETLLQEGYTACKNCLD